MTHTITRRLRFEAGHRVVGHESKCAHPHGHSYVVLIEARALDGGLDGIGRVVDFGVIKAEVGVWIDDHLDHAFLVARDDHELRATDWPNLFPMDNPTAENIAALLYGVAVTMLEEHNIEVVSVTVQETENCTATYRPGATP